MAVVIDQVVHGRSAGVIEVSGQREHRDPDPGEFTAMRLHALPVSIEGRMAKLSLPYRIRRAIDGIDLADGPAALEPLFEQRRPAVAVMQRGVAVEAVVGPLQRPGVL